MLFACNFPECTKYATSLDVSAVLSKMMPQCSCNVLYPTLDGNGRSPFERCRWRATQLSPFTGCAKAVHRARNCA